ncbi:glutathione S-transferase [Maricaulis sp.]|uniref:glutathione S-transferase n=1 Tax=Maricaulis sp. TaxID=1486257 RepID=UPI002B269334|nr:glutathione S-transferase [Maricaulis sp.]
MILTLENVINETCPWSGRPVSAGALMWYRGAVVGFCNPGCRDKFEAAVSLFERCRVEAPSDTANPTDA